MLVVNLICSFEKGKRDKNRKTFLQIGKLGYNLFCMINCYGIVIKKILYQSPLEIF